MFWWKKKKQNPADDIPHLTGQEGSSSAPLPNLSDTIRPLTVVDVMDNFLVQNPSPTPYSVHALINAGATELLTPGEVLEACYKIHQHGYQFPLNPTLQAELQSADLLKFLRWQEQSEIGVESYQNENTIRQLIKRFRGATG
jgi:hypothetical protein